jgi:hypothetical protein
MPTNEEINEVQEWINSGRIYAPTSCDRARLIRFLETLAGAYRELLGRVEATEAELAAMKADAEMGSYSDAALDNQALREHLAIEAHYRLALEDIANLQTIIKDNGLYDFTLEDARAVARDRLAKPAPSAEPEAIREALQNIADQGIRDEMDEDTVEDADWEAGYEALIKIARTALEKE